MHSPSLSIIIVNWNTGNLLSKCIASIQFATRDNFHLKNIVVIDNNSSDGSLVDIENLGAPVLVIKNAENRGFAAACNQGAARTKSDYLLFLNPDTTLAENSLQIPINFMEQPENKTIGICGIQLVDDNGKECLSYTSFPHLKKFFQQAIGLKRVFAGDHTGPGIVPSAISDYLVVDQVIGAFFVVRRNVYEQLNGFDEHFFVYFEEVDFSLRALHHGWKSVCLTDVYCGHVGGGSSHQVKAARLFYSLRSRLLYGCKHFTPASTLLLASLTLLIEFPARLLFACIRKSADDFSNTIHGYWLLLRTLPATLGVAGDIRKSLKRDTQ